MVKNILITGSSGYLGQHLLASLCKIGEAGDGSSSYKITAAYGTLESFEADAAPHLPPYVTLVKNFDLSSDDNIASLVDEYGPFDVVVHLAAISSPGVCQKNQDEAQKVNVPSALLEALPADDTEFIFLSTDQVYDGTRAPYLETDKAEPVNLYGETKLEFEELLLTKHKMRAMALRSSLILGSEAPLGACRKQTFLQFVYDRLKQQQETQFFTDEYRNVVYVGDIVKVIQYFIYNGIAADKTGVYNMGGADRVSRLDIAKAVAEHCGFDMACAKGVARASLPPGPVASPPDISMNNAKLEEATGIQMLGLADIVKLSLKRPTNDS